MRCRREILSTELIFSQFCFFPPELTIDCDRNAGSLAESKIVVGQIPQKREARPTLLFKRNTWNKTSGNTRPSAGGDVPHSPLIVEEGRPWRGKKKGPLGPNERWAVVRLGNAFLLSHLVEIGWSVYPTFVTSCFCALPSLPLSRPRNAIHQ